MLTGILVPTAGRLTVWRAGPGVAPRDLPGGSAVVFASAARPGGTALADSFDLLRTSTGADAGAPGPVGACAEGARARGVLATPVRQLSLGQRMRGEVTAALLHAPPLLVLDEPTVGLDLVSKERLRAFLHEVNTEDGVTVLLTTHDLPDVERLCARGVIDQGRVVATTNWRPCAAGSPGEGADRGPWPRRRPSWTARPGCPG